MIEVKGLSKIEEIANKIEFEKKVKRDIKKDQIKQLTVQGIDKKTAKAMVEAFQSVGLA